MRWAIDASSLPGYLTVMTEGPPAVRDSRSLWNELLAGPDWRAGTCILFDNRKMDAFPNDGSGSEIIAAALSFFESSVERIGSSRIAVLIARPENFTFHRQFQYGLSLRGMPANVQIFYNEQEAKDWLDISFRTATA